MKMITIKLSQNDLGQIIDGLEVRRKAWQDTANFLRDEYSPDDSFICEECTDEDEAQNLADWYERIINSLTQQAEKQR